jgi:hypothetical protein
MIWRLQRTIIKNETERETRDKDREKLQVLTLRGVNASLALGEATACAIRDGHCNGEVTRALETARRTKDEQKLFLEEQAVKNLI